MHLSRVPVRPDVSGVSGDRDLRERLFSLVCRQMHALYGKWQPDFDDLVQTAVEQALRALPSFRRESELSTWTYRICYRALIRHRRWYRRWLVRFTLDAPDADAPVRDRDVPEALEERERHLRLRAALDHLSPKRRAVVMLRDIEGFEIDEIASVVGANPATVRSRLRDARRDLSARLADDPYFSTAERVEDEP